MIMLEEEVKQYVGFHNAFYIGKLNEEGKSILNFSMIYDFKIANICFKKWEEQ